MTKLIFLLFLTISYAQYVNYPGGGGGNPDAAIGPDPGFSTDMAFPRWDGATGRLLQNSGVIADDLNNVTGINNLSVAGTLTLNTLLNTYIFPITRGAAGETFLSDGLGNLTWTPVNDANTVLHPNTSTDEGIVRWDGTTGKLVQDSGVLVSDTNDISEVQMLSVKGKNTNTLLLPVAAVNFGTGRTSAHALNSGQANADIAIEEGQAGGGSRHFISSTHSGSTVASNSIRFHINSSSVTSSTAPGVGNTMVMALLPGGVGIHTTSPDADLDVDGDAVIKGQLSLQDGTAEEYSFPITRGTVGQTIKSDGAGNSTWGDDTLAYKNFIPATQYFAGDWIKIYDEQLFQARVDFVSNADPLVDIGLKNMEFRSPNDFTTSPLRGGVITYAAPNYSVTAGSGVIVTNGGTPFSQIASVAWPASTVTLPNTGGYNTIQVNSAGVVSAVSGVNTALGSKQNVVLGIVFAPTNQIIPKGTAAVDHGNDMRTFSLLIGLVKSGIIFTGNVGAQTFITTSGSIFFDGIGKGTETPNIRTCPAQAVTSFRLYDQDTDLGIATNIPNNQYDVAGTLTAIPGTNWTYFKMFLAPNCQIILQYGQDVAPSKNEITALEDENRDTYVVNPQLQGVVKFIGVVYFQNNNADFSSIATTSWENSGLFGIGTAGSGSSITATGDILGPDTSVDAHPALFDGTTGKLIKDASGATFDPNGGLTLDGGTAGLLVTKPTGTANLQNNGLTFTNTASTFSLALLPSPAPAGNVTLTFPPNAPSANQILQSDSFGQLSWVPNGSLTNWQASHAYIAGETVVSPADSNDVFRALSAHTSTASFTADRVAGRWEMISPSHFIPFTPTKQYFAEDLIRISDGAIYKATGDFIANANPAVDIAAGRMEFMSPGDYTTSASSGGAVTFAGTTYTITAGTGFIVTNGGTPFSTIQNVTWPLRTIVEPLPNPTGYNTISVSNAGVVSASSGLDTPASAKTSIVLATVFAPSRTIILRNGAATDHGNTNRSLSLILGMLKDKIEFTGNANLTFQTKAGSIYWDGIAPGTEQPNVRNCPVQTATSFIRYDQDSAYAVNTLLDTLNWDNGGTLAGIPANNWGYHKIFLAPNCQVYIQYGQQFAASEAAITAAEEAGRNSYITNPALASGMKFVGLVFFQQNRTDVSESALVTWVNSGLFGMGVAGSGSTVTTNGDVFGPASAIDRAIAVFDGGSGKTLVDTLPTIDTAGSITGVRNLTVKGLNTNNPSATSALNLMIGRTNAGGYVAGQTSADIAFDYGAGDGGYRHFISTQHSGTASLNTMNFWINNGAQTVSTAPGTGNDLALSLTGEGKVGVGTKVPFDALDVVGGIVTSFHGNASQHHATEVGNRRIGHISGTNAEFAGMQVNVKTTESDGTTARANTADLAFYTWGQSIAASNEQMRITERGRVGINTTNPISLLSVNGDLTVGGAGSTANVGVGNLKLVGPVTNAAGPHMTFNDDTDIYPQRHFLNWGHNSIHDCFDCYFDGTNWRNSTTSSSFRWTKDAVYLQLSAVEVPTVGGTEAASPIAYFHENGSMLLRKWQSTGGSANYPYQGGTLSLYTSRGRVAELRGLSTGGGNLDGSSEMYNNCGGWGWRRAWEVQTQSPPAVYFEGAISASNVTNRSSAILKKNITPIPPEDLQQFLKLNPIKYQNRDAPYLGRKRGEPLSEAEVDNTWRYGFVIEAMEELMPKIIEGKGKFTQTIMEYDESGVATATDAPVAAYSIPSLLALTVEAVHKLNDKVDELIAAQPGTPTEPTEPVDTSMFVVGPATSIDNNIPRFDGTTGKKVQGSGIKIDDLNNFTGINNITLSASITAGGSLTAGGSGQFGGTVSALDFIVNGAAMSATMSAQKKTIADLNKTVADLLKRIKALEKKK